jgi:hypothetical protein
MSHLTLRMEALICDLNQDLLPYLGLVGGAPADVALATQLQNSAERLVKQFVKSQVEQGSFTEILPAYTREIDMNEEFLSYDKLGNSAVAFGRWDNQQILALANVPVRSVEKVYITYTPGLGANPPPGALFDPASYFLDVDELGISRTGFLICPFMVWPRAGRSNQIQYTAGYTQAELDMQTGRWPEFKLAVCLTVGKAYHTAKTQWKQQMGFGGFGPINSEGMDGVSFSYDSATTRTVAGQIAALTPEVKDMLAEHVNYSQYVGFLG